MIPFNRTVFCPEAYERVKAVMEKGWPGLGPEVAAFEKEFAERMEARYAVATNSGTEALRLVVNAFGHPKTVAISTPNTFVSTNHVLLQQGMRVVFADIDPDTGSLSIESVKRMLVKYKLHTDVSLIMAVHFAGMPIDLYEFREIAKYYKIPLIEDSAHATGAFYRKKPIGKDSIAACFSFHAVKNLPIGDGGMLLTNDKTLYERAMKMRWLGIDRSTVDRIKGTKYTWEYNVPLIGYKSHMNDLMATIGRAQLKHLDEDNAKRVQVVEWYLEGLKDMKDVKPLDRPKDRVSSNHLFIVRCEKRDEIRQALTKNEIQWGMHYRPNYSHDVYLGTAKDGKMEGTEEYYRTAISLPCHILLTKKDVDTVVKVVKEVV